MEDGYAAMPMWMNHRDCVGGNKIRMLMFVGMIGANDMMMMMATTLTIPSRRLTPKEEM